MSLARTPARAVAAALALLAGAAGGLCFARGGKDVDPSWLALKDCPDEPGCPAIVLLDETELSNASARARLSRRQVVKIFTESGIADHADVEVIETLGQEECKNLAGRTILPDGKILPLKQEHIFVKPAYRKGSLRLRVKAAKFPGVVPGAIIDYSYDLVDPRASYYTEWVWRFQEDLAVLKARLTLRPGEVPFAWHAAGPHKDRIVHTHPYLYVHYFDVGNLPSPSREPLSPPPGELRTRLHLFRPTDQMTWIGKVARAFVGGAGLFLDRSLGIPEKLSELVPSDDPPVEKLKRVYRFVQEEIATEQARSGRKAEADVKDAENVGDVLKRGYGNEFERTMLFLGMAKELGMPVGLLVIADRRNTILNTDAPDEGQFETFGAAVKIGEDWTFYDPAVKHCRFGMISWFKEGGLPNAILVTPEKTVMPSLPVRATTEERLAAMAVVRRLQSAPYMLSAIPFSKAADNVLMREATVRLAADGSAVVDVLEQTRGQTDLERHMEYEDRTDEERRIALADQLADIVPGARIDSASFEGLDAFDRSLAIRYRLSIESLATVVGDRTILTPSLFGAAAPNPFTARTRMTAVHFPYARKEVDRITFELPEGASVPDLPAAILVREGPFALVAGFSAEPGRLVFSRRLEIDAAIWPVERYPQLRSFFERAQQAERETVTLRMEVVP